jgi:hypothetical protein
MKEKPHVAFGRNCPPFLRKIVEEVIPNAVEISSTEMDERIMQTIQNTKEEPMRQFEARNIAIETVARALRPYHRHGDEASAYDALCVEFADLSTNTLTALQQALSDLETLKARRQTVGVGSLTAGEGMKL